MRKSICYVANPKWPHVERWAKWFALHSDYDVHLLSEEEPSFNGVSWHRFHIDTHSLFPWTVRAFAAFRRVYSLIKPDLVHMHNLEYAMFPASLAWSGPAILTTYGLDITMFDNPGSTWKARALKRVVLRRAHAVTAASQFLADLTETVGGLGPEKVHVTPFGVDTDWFRRSTPCSEHSWVTVGMPKDLKQEYGPCDFIRAMDILARRGVEVRGYIQGDGPERAVAKSLVRELGLESRLEIRGRVPLDAMKDVYEHTDICVLPSLRESFGVAALEAQSMEIPVVATNVEGLAEVLVDGVTGLHVPARSPEALADAIERLAVNPELRRTMGRSARDFVVDRFDWRKTVQIMDGLYRNLTTPREARS